MIYIPMRVCPNVCTYVCVCIYIYIYIYIYAHGDSAWRTDEHTHACNAVRCAVVFVVFFGVCVCVCVRVRACLFVFKFKLCGSGECMTSA